MKTYLTIFGKPRYLGRITAEENETLKKGDRLLAETSRGLEIAIAAGEISERQEDLYRSIDNRQEGQPSNDSGLQNITYIRHAEPRDLENEDINRADEEKALITARQILSTHALDMKLVDVEYMNDRKKLFLYFTSEQRVDFRAYVRDLAREFRTRIELRQIGVRDEAKVVKGLGACGRTCCCSYWLQKFMPIGIRMVKEQNLALNPTKISGLCGRLMCCMSYEQTTYHELWKKLPAHGAKIKTEEGTWTLLGVDLPTNTCMLHGPSGSVNIPVDMYQTFKEIVQAGEKWDNEAHGLDEKGRPLVPYSEGDYPEPQFRSCCGHACTTCRKNLVSRSAASPVQEKQVQPEAQLRPSQRSDDKGGQTPENKRSRRQDNSHPHRSADTQNIQRSSRQHAAARQEHTQEAAPNREGQEQRTRRPRRRPHHQNSTESHPQNKNYEKATER